MKTYLLAEDGKIVNAVQWDGASDWSPPKGQSLLEVEMLPPGTWVGAKQVNGEWVMPPPPPPSPRGVPYQVSPAEAEIALFRYDDGVLLARVNALIEKHPYEPVRIWWRKATYISRNHPYLQALALELGLSDKTVDALFISADGAI